MQYTRLQFMYSFYKANTVFQDNTATRQYVTFKIKSQTI